MPVICQENEFINFTCIIKPDMKNALNYFVFQFLPVTLNEIEATFPQTINQS